MDINVKRMGGTHGYTLFDRQITRSQYEAAQANRGYMPKDAQREIFTDSERLGYGASASSVYENNGLYFVRCMMYNNCE